MSVLRLLRTFAVLAVAHAVVLWVPLPSPALAQEIDWREEQAYTLGVQAFVYGFPWAFLSELRWEWVTQPPSDPEGGPYAPLNQFWHARKLFTAADRTGGSPNTDTMYSFAWVDLSDEPVILSVPAISDRYYTFQMSSMDSDNFAYVGARATGTTAGSYAIIGPDWVGMLPPEVVELPPSRTPYALIVGRTLVYDVGDVPNVHAIQSQYRLTPLSQWGGPYEASGDRDVWAPYETTDPLAIWKTMNRAMTENPPNVASQQSMLDSFATIGVGPNQDVDAMDDATKRGLQRAAQEGMAIMRGFNLAGGYGHLVNGWRYPPSTMGRAGQYNDFLTRAASQCFVGIVAHDPEEGIYLNTGTDAEGIRLSGANDYVIRFPAGGLPDVGAFWSITMYAMDHNLVDNPLDRYKVGTYPEDLMRFDPDGSLTIYVQHESPGVDRESNWLPAPDGAFYLIMRTYLPGPSVLSQTWQPPPVVAVVRR